MLTNEQTYTGYCLKCKKKQQMNDVEILEMKNGLKRAQGICNRCNTKISKILPKKQQ